MSKAETARLFRATVMVLMAGIAAPSLVAAANEYEVVIETPGFTLVLQYCAPCHGANAEGRSRIEPPQLYTGDKFPRWKNQLFLGSLAAHEFRRIVPDGGRVVQQELVLRGAGRIRDIHTSRDGCLYLALERYNRFGNIVRLLPAPE